MKITFDSEVGKGTEFLISLPVAAGIPPVTQKIPTMASPSRRGKVLVIDDEETLGQALRRRGSAPLRLDDAADHGHRASRHDP